jgi:hypothetical protein
MEIGFDHLILRIRFHSFVKKLPGAEFSHSAAAIGQSFRSDRRKLGVLCASPARRVETCRHLSAVSPATNPAAGLRPSRLRQIFGRASLDLLKARALKAA